MTQEVNALADLLARAGAARARGDLAAAEPLYVEAAAQFPAEAEPHHHLGGLHHMQDRLGPAEAAYRRALALAPGAPSTERALAVLLLSQGRYAEGFALLEARHQLAAMKKPDLPYPEWRGEDLAGKRLAIWPEQGFGDQIQFARFAPILKTLGAEVILFCRPQLVRLFETSLGIAVLAAEGEVEFPVPDFWVMQGSLAARLGVTVDAIPNAPYLHAPAAAPPLGGGFKIGLKTEGNPGHHNDANRSLPPAPAQRLRHLPARIVELDPAVSGARDFAETAALVEQLDLVICVDTSVAHLAGAMGKPVWMLVPAVDTDWRWLRERTDSPWYPSMRLYRQARGEPWDAVVDRVVADLGTLIAPTGDV